MALSPLGIAIMQMQAQPAQARPGSVTPTDVLGAYQLSGNMAEQQYQAQLAQQNALWGGLAGLGSAGIIGASKVPAVTNAISNWFTPGSAPSAVSGGGTSLGGAAASPLAFSGSPAGGVTAADVADDTAADAAGGFPAGMASAGGLPNVASLGSWMSDPAFAGLAGGATEAGTGSVAADAAATAAAAGGDAAAGGIGASLASLFPFLLAAA